MSCLNKIRRNLGQKEIIILLAIFFIGLVLRLIFINYGLPRLYFEDEEFFVTPALGVAQGGFDPGWYQAPAQPLIYVLGFSFRGLNFFINRINDTIFLPSQNYSTFISFFQSLGRLIPILFGSFTIILAYLLGKHWHKRTGLFAAGLVAFSFYHIEHSYIIRPDIIQTFFLILALIFFFRLIDRPEHTRYYIFCGASLGVAVTMKYPSLFFLVPALLIFFWLWKKGKMNLKKWSAGLSAFLFFSFLTGPFLYFKVSRVIKAVLEENRMSHGGHDGLGVWGNLWWYVSDSLNWQLGTVLSLIVLAVIFFAVYKVSKREISDRDFKLFVLVIAALSYLVMISVLNLHWERWMIPVMTILFVLAAIGLDFLLNIFKKNILAIILILLLVFAAPTLRLVRTVYGLASPNTIEEARNFVIDNIPENTYIAEEPYTPDLKGTSIRVFEVGNLSYHDFDYYKNEGITHFIVSEYVYGRIVEQAERYDPALNYTRAVEKYNKLFENSKLIYSIFSHKEYSADELIKSNDFMIFKNLSINLKRGPYLKIYGF